MRSKYLILFLLACVLFFTNNGWTQEHVFFWGEELGVGARAMAMGGAYVGVADDYSAVYWNPAGIGQMRRMEFNLGFNHNMVSNKASFLGNQYDATGSTTRMNSLGFIFPIPTYRGSLVFGFGYNKVRDYDNVLEIEGFNPHYAAFPDIVVPTYTDWITDVNDSLLQNESILEEGSRNQYTLSAAVEMQENFYIGVSMNIVRGRNDYGLHFVESDVRNLYRYFNESEKNVSDLDYWDYNQSIATDFNATNWKFGILYHMGQALRVGATVTTGTHYKLKENWSEDWKEYYDTAIEPAEYDDSGNYEYEIREPYTFGLGASYRVSNLLLSGALDYKDWSQAKFLTEPSVSSVSMAEVNRAIRSGLKAVTTMRFGVEYYVPILLARVRAGYFNQPSPYKNVELRPKKNFYSAGVSFMLDKQVMMDVAYVTGKWKQQTSDDLTNDPTLEDKKFSKLIGTLSIRF